jgi:AcrR family transcriptional regulator
MSKRSRARPAPLIWQQPAPPPRQRTLGRDEIVAAAIALADVEGASGITMKAVASKLGAYTPMALYRYIYNKEGLVDLMLDAASAEISVPAAPSADWRADLQALALDSRRMIARHPWFGALTHTRPPAGPHQMRRLEFMLAVLTGRGAQLSAAMTYAALIDRHVIGSGLQEAEEARSEQRAGMRASRAAYTAAFTPVRELAARGPYPLLHQWLTHPSGASPDRQFELGLTFLLDGIAASLTHKPNKRGSSR